jgi:hypothetical protein
LRGKKRKEERNGAVGSKNPAGSKVVSEMKLCHSREAYEDLPD